MRILHTSDWHLGISHGAASRGPDHDHFFAWLEAELQSRQVHALVIAGDVFDSMQPSADALQRYYRLLARVGRTGVSQVVVVGGNHDSASRLDAPAHILGALDVHVVGGIGGTEASWERCLVPLRGASGEPEAVMLAVPYVHEFRLGVRTTDLDHAAMRTMFQERFANLYTHLANEAQARWPGLPLVATGHLTLGTAKREDYPHEIHQVGQLDGLPPSVIDARIQYAALGHIHRAYPVGPDKRAWYSGSPIAFSLPEAATARRVLQVDIDANPAGRAQVTPIEVPSPRALVELTATPDDLVRQVAALTFTEPLPPLLFCRAVTDAMPSDLSSRLHDALAALPEARRPTLVELRQQRATPLVHDPEEGPPTPLDELTPTEVFAKMCAASGRTDAPALQVAFASLASATADDFEAMVKQAREARA